MTSVKDDNGWEAWRSLNAQYEPATAIKEAMVMAQYTGMVTKRAKNPEETKKMMVDLEERARRVHEVTGDEITGAHAMNVIVGIIDTETLKHTAHLQGAKADVGVLKRKIMEFTNMMATTGKNDMMDLDRVEERMKEEEEEEEESEEGGKNGSEENYGYAYQIGTTCYECWGTGH